MAAKDQYSTNLGLSILPEVSQKEHPTIYLEFMKLRNALRSLQGALDTYTGALSEDPAYWNQVANASSTRLQNISRVYAVAGEAITLAQQVSFYNNAGVLTARKANSTDNTKPSRAFCSVTAGVAAGSYGEFILMGVNPYYAGLTPGATYYLHTTSGQITITPPAAVGNIVQEVGFALDANTLFFNPTLHWTQL